MLKVDLLQTTLTGQETVVTVGLDGDRIVVLKGSKSLAKGLGLLDGPIYGLRQKAFYPKDGRKFLEAMRYQFSGSMIRATAPYEEE